MIIPPGNGIMNRLSMRIGAFAAKYMTHLPSEEELRKEIEIQKAIYYSEHPEEDERTDR